MASDAPAVPSGHHASTASAASAPPFLSGSGMVMSPKDANWPPPAPPPLHRAQELGFRGGVSPKARQLGEAKLPVEMDVKRFLLPMQMELGSPMKHQTLVTEELPGARQQHQQLPRVSPPLQHTMSAPVLGTQARLGNNVWPTGGFGASRGISPATSNGSLAAFSGPRASGGPPGGFGTQANVTGQSSVSSQALRTGGLAVLRSGPFRRQMIAGDYPKSSFFVQDYRHAYDHIEQERELTFLRELFLSADTNGSGDVDYEEFQTCMLNPATARIFMQRFGFQPHMAAEIFRSLDSDGSGEVDVEEWIAKLKILMNYVDSGKEIKDWRSRALKEIPGYSEAGGPDDPQNKQATGSVINISPMHGPDFPRAPQSTAHRSRTLGPGDSPKPLPLLKRKASALPGGSRSLEKSNSQPALVADTLRASQYFMKLYPVKLPDKLKDMPEICSRS